MKNNKTVSIKTVLIIILVFVAVLSGIFSFYSSTSTDEIFLNFFINICVNSIWTVITIIFVDKYLRNHQEEKIKRIKTNIERSFFFLTQKLISTISIPLGFSSFQNDYKKDLLVSHQRNALQIIQEMKDADLNTKVKDINQLSLEDLYVNLKRNEEEVYKLIILYKNYIQEEIIEDLYNVYTSLGLLISFTEKLVDKSKDPTNRIYITFVASSLDVYVEILESLYTKLKKAGIQYENIQI